MIKKIAFIIVLTFINTTIAQTPLDAEFTYQGNLETTGSPANGQFDFRFMLFDTESDGTGVNLGQVNVDDLEVDDGLFTTTLNFGDASFVGNKVWMEIGIRDGVATGGYQKLLPRQQITATPYATHAQFVEFIDNDAITASQISNNAVGNSEIDNSQVQTRISQVCGAGFFMKSVNQDGSVVCAVDVIGLSSITSTEIVDATIQTVDIANNAITRSKILNSSVNSTKIADNSITANDLAVGSVGSNEIIPTQVQTRVTGSCASPLYLSGIKQDGSVVCQRLPLGFDYVLDSEPDGGLDISIAIGNDGLPIISYSALPNFDLKVVKCTTASCSSFNTPVTLDSVGDVGIDISIAIGTDGLPIISYSDFTNFDLKVVKCTAISCSSFITPITLDSTDIVGRSNSIAIGADGLPIISYFDGTNGNLKVVKCTTASCSSFNAPLILDSLGRVGYDTSIAIGIDGLPIISYSDFTNFDLKVVKCSTVSCSSFNTPLTLDSTDTVGHFNSIAIGDDGLPIISYYDKTNGNLKIVKCITISCSVFNTPLILDSIGDVGLFNSITIGTDGLPIISYYDYTNFDLKVVKCTSASCNSINPPLTLDRTSDVGAPTSISIGADDLPVISYFDVTNGHLKVYSCGDVDCKR